MLQLFLSIKKKKNESRQFQKRQDILKIVPPRLESTNILYSVKVTGFNKHTNMKLTDIVISTISIKIKISNV